MGCFTVCDMKAIQINMQHVLIQKRMLYEFEQGSKCHRNNGNLVQKKKELLIEVQQSDCARNFA